MAKETTFPRITKATCHPSLPTSPYPLKTQARTLGIDLWMTRWRVRGGWGGFGKAWQLPINHSTKIRDTSSLRGSSRRTRQYWKGFNSRTRYIMFMIGSTRQRNKLITWRTSATTRLACSRRRLVEGLNRTGADPPCETPRPKWTNPIGSCSSYIRPVWESQQTNWHSSLVSPRIITTWTARWITARLQK